MKNDKRKIKERRTGKDNLKMAFWNEKHCCR